MNSTRTISTTMIISIAWILCSTICSIDGARLAPIYWNSSNEIFASANEESRMLTVKIMDRLDIHCPFYNDTVSRDDAEFSFIYSVTEKGYEECDADQGRAIGICTSPFGQESLVTLAFREFSPNPNAIEFKRGETYYFITTSTGAERGIRNTKGGLCQKFNMRLRVKVEDDEEETKEEEKANGRVENGGGVGKVDSKSGASSLDGHERSTQDDLDQPSAISSSSEGGKGGGNVLYATGRRATLSQGKQHETAATERRQGPTSDSTTTISGQHEDDSHEKTSSKKEEDATGVKFAVDNDDKLIPSSPGAIDAVGDGGNNAVVVKHGSDNGGGGNADSLTYHPFGAEINSNSVKRDRHTSEKWRNAKGNTPGRYEGKDNIVLYEIHEMEPQRINRYPSSSASSARPMSIGRNSVVLPVLVILLTALVRWRFL